MASRSLNPEVTRSPAALNSKPRACISCRARKIRCDLTSHGAPCSSCERSSLPCREAYPKRRRITVAEAAIASETAESHQSGSANTLDNKYQTLGDGDDEPRNVFVEGTQDISTADSILVEFLAQDFDTGSVGEYQATYIDDYANVVRILGTTFGRGFKPDIRHFRDAPFIKRLNGSIPRNISQQERALLNHSGAFVLPDPRIANGLITAFFDRVHPTMPIIDQQEFRNSYAQLSSNSLGPPLLLIHAILLSGSTVWKHPDLKLPAEEVSMRMFTRAQALVHHRFEQDRYTLVVAHLLFSTFASDSCDDTVQNTWLSLGSAVRIAQGLGLHRSLGLATNSESHRREWRKTWWTLFLHDTMCAFEWGRPRAIVLADTDVEEITEADFASNDSGALPNIEHVSFFLEAIKLCFIMSDWLDLLRPGGPRRKRQDTRKDQDSVHRIRADLHKWYDELPLLLKPEEGRGRYTLWSGTLNIAYHGAVIRFYSTGPVDMQKVHESSAVISSICLTLYEQGLLESIWVYAIHQLYLAMCHHARETRDSDPNISAQSLEKLQRSIPILEQLSHKSSVAKQAVRFLEKVASGTISDEGSTGASGDEGVLWQQPTPPWLSHINDMNLLGDFGEWDGGGTFYAATNTNIG